MPQSNTPKTKKKKTKQEQEKEWKEENPEVGQKEQLSSYDRANFFSRYAMAFVLPLLGLGKLGALAADLRERVTEVDLGGGEVRNGLLDLVAGREPAGDEGPEAGQVARPVRHLLTHRSLPRPQHR